MNGHHLHSLETLEEIARALGELNSDVVYVGGAVLGLYINDKGADEARVTMDIDKF